MREWVLEEFDVSARDIEPEVLSIGIDVLRSSSAPQAVAEILRSVKGRSKKGIPPVLVPDTFDRDDMSALVATAICSLT